jgi:DNA-binding transcriptional LysR family regulator
VAGLDWNDLRYFLAVARTGSTLAAGKAMRVSHTTAARRLAALETALNLTLFDHLTTGYVLTPAGEALLEAAEAMEAAAAQVADVAARQSREASGTVKLTVDELFAVTLLAPILRDLRKAHPAIRIELDTTETHRDLAAGEADIALRMTRNPIGGGLVGRRIATSSWALYGSRDYVAAHGLPRQIEELQGHVLVGGGGTVTWKIYRTWLERHGLLDSVAVQHGTTSGLLAAVRSGVGLAVLPSTVADVEPDLVMCLPDLPQYKTDLWLLTHERLRHTPRVRVVLDFLADGLTQRRREAHPRRASEDDSMAPRVPSGIKPKA